MEISGFAQKVRDAVEEKLGGGYKVEAREVKKNNGMILYGLSIAEQGNIVVPVIYLESFLEAYKSGMPFDGVVRRLLTDYEENKIPEGFNVEFYRHFEMVKDRICYRLVGREKNGHLLDSMPHMEFLDLAVCFYYVYHDRNFGEGFIPVKTSHMEEWGTTASELFQLAQMNTPRLFPWKRFMMEDVVKEMGAENIMEDSDEILSDTEEDLPMPPMIILTNTAKLFGASCMLYPGVLEELAVQEGKNLFILPSSLHETILLPDVGDDAGGLKKMISEVNRTQVAPEEVLSDSLYYYDLAKKDIKIL